MSLNNIIEKLKSHLEVDSVFITGSQVTESKPYSDIDLVIILNRNINQIKSIYTWIDDKFADIFFFDLEDLERIENLKEISDNSMDAIFINWLLKGQIQFDKTNQLTELKEKSDALKNTAKIPESEKSQYWQKINYNFVANKRYFESNDPIYHEALELRLLYTIPELICGYFQFRDISWQGEKQALKYLKENDQEFYDLFISYTKAQNLNDRFENYSKMIEKVFVGVYKIWQKDQIIAETKDEKSESKNKAIEFWKELIE